MTAPEVSVLCPTYNRSTAIGPTLTSVLEQEAADLELLVGSDGSDDDTDDVVAGFARSDPRVRLVRLPRRADPGLVRRDLARRAGAPVLAYVDHDDLWHPHHLTTALDVLRGGPPAVVTATDYDAPPGVVAVGTAATWSPEIAVLDPFAEPTRVVHRHDALVDAGGWRTGRTGLEDWDTWWRMTRTGTTFQPITECTSTVTLSTASRRNGLPMRPLVVLASAADLAAARRAVAGWAASSAPDALHEDARAWYLHQRADPHSRRPSPHAGAVGERDARDALARAVCTAPRIVPGGPDGWLVTLAAPIVDRRHRAEAAALLRHRFARHLTAARRFFAHQSELLPIKETTR